MARFLQLKRYLSSSSLARFKGIFKQAVYKYNGWTGNKIEWHKQGKNMSHWYGVLGNSHGKIKVVKPFLTMLNSSAVKLNFLWISLDLLG